MTAQGPARSGDSPERIGKYEIVAKIGEGAMGEVYQARDTVLDRFVAIKTMSKSVLANPEMGQRFLREAKSAARLNHPNVVILHEFGEDAGRFFMAMELLSGEDLARVLRRGGLPELQDKLTVMEQILDGVAYAHAAGIVHRDLKPANIQIQPNGQVKVMDFGLARIGASEMTRTGTVMGTPHYMSPEQVRGEATSPASDVFALGSVFYEILGGRRAFDADSMHAVLFKVAEAQPIPLSECRADIPPILVRFVGKALVKASELRYHDAAEMRAALQLCRQVLEGSLDEAAALGAMGEAPTIIHSPDGSAAATLLEPTTEALSRSGTAASLTSGSRTALGGSLAATRRGTRIGSTPTSLPAAPPTGAAPAPSAASRMPFLVGGAIIVGLIAVLLLRGPRTSEAPPVNPQAQAAVRAAVDAQVDSARRSLDFKDPEAAIAAAEKALGFEPDNQEAREIARQAQSVLTEVEADAGEARRAAEAGELDQASQALARVLDRMPKHPVAAELSARLASRFQGRADGAEKEMSRAAEAARKAGASSLRAYADATAYAGRARAAYRGKQYTEAAQLFSEARRSYEVSTRDARELEAKRTAAAQVASVAPQPTLAPTAPPAPAIPRPTLAPTPAPAPTVVSRPIAPPPAPPVPDDDAAIRQVVADLKKAIEDRDLALYKKVRPGLTADEERRLRDAFRNVVSQEVEYRIDGLTIQGDRATVKAIRGGRVAGQSVPDVAQTLRLVRSGNGWVIEEIGQ